MKQIEKRRAMDTMMNFGHKHAGIFHDLTHGVKDAATDESPLLPIYARLSALSAFYFLEMAEVLTRVPTLVARMDLWGQMVREQVGEYWTEGERTRFDWLLSEYARAVEGAGGEEPVGVPSSIENEEFTVMFDDRDEDDEDD